MVAVIASGVKPYITVRDRSYHTIRGYYFLLYYVVIMFKTVWHIFPDYMKTAIVSLILIPQYC